MPVLDFESEDGKIISVLVRITEPDEARHVQIVDGVTYKRVYAAPTAIKDTKHGDATKEDFGRMTEGKNMTVGQMQDLAKELSEERAAKNGGIDPVKEKYYKDYEKKIGQKHSDVKLREARARLAKFGVKIG